MTETQTTMLYYVLDPMCSWCWGFRPTFLKVLKALPEDCTVRYIMGGLAKDSDQPMPDETRTYVQQAWRDVAARTGVEFNHRFWEDCHPRRSTYPACRAVIAAGVQRESAKPEMILGIQQAYYLQARNPSDADTLICIANDLKLDVKQFSRDLNCEGTERLLQEDLSLRRKLGVSSFPSLLLEIDSEIHWLAEGCVSWEEIEGRLKELLA